MVDGNNGYGQPTGYAQPTGQRGYGAPSSWTSPPAQSPGSPAYGASFAHSHTQDTDPFVAASSQVAIDIETISLNYREIRDAIQDINTPKDTVEFRQTLYVALIFDMLQLDTCSCGIIKLNLVSQLLVLLALNPPANSNQTLKILGVGKLMNQTR